MTRETSNPFEITKAVDLTDEEIASTWVDLPGGGFGALADPTSPMPKFIVGGKGGGRTHLLRYFSFALQRLRHGERLLDGISEDGYLGIYFRCPGLNSSRFADKGQSQEVWNAVFAYYTEIWLGRLTIDLLADSPALLKDSGVGAALRFVDGVRALFDCALPEAEAGGEPLKGLSAAFRSIQRDLDRAVNNVALTRQLQITIDATPGRLVFGVPAVAADAFSSLRDLSFAYLVDEFENLTMEQQRYMNTLIREKELPCTFIVGSRLFGMRTQGTLSAGEENRQGSEYDLVVLENTYRLDKSSYRQFCLEIVRRRLFESGFEPMGSGKLEDYFENPQDGLEERARRHVSLGEEGERGVSRRPWLQRLRDQLADIIPDREVAAVVGRMEQPEQPLLEKFAIFLLYRAWFDGLSISESAADISERVGGLMTELRGRSTIAITYRHYKADLYAQLLDDLRRPQEYLGFHDFVALSGFLPRNLLISLKHATRWSLFLGEEPFRKNPLSARAQAEGIREASSWFLNDSKGLGRVGEEAQIAVRRLGSLFREMRFSDKPAEVACSAFSTDRQGLTRAAVSTLDEAISHSLLLEVPSGRRDRNSRVVQHKYQLNPMLAPMFDLSLALRGVADLSTKELNAIFDPAVSEDGFATEKAARLARLNAPFGGVTGQSGRLFE
jgi:hypothetical protein